MPDEPEGLGLLGLLLLIQARRPARTAADGSLVVLAEQDGSLWNGELVTEGQVLVGRQRPGPFQIQAAINAVHSDAASAGETDWAQIVELYDQLMRFTATPIVALNRAIALGERDGPDAALAVIEGLARPSYQPFHASI